MMLTSALAGLTSTPQWFLYRLSYNHAKAKYDKTPCRTDGTSLDKDEPSSSAWTTYEAARAARLVLGNGYTLGFYFTDDLGYWFLDVDGCVVNGKLSEWADYFYRSLHGAFFEYSSSGRGIHLVGRGQRPEHRTRPTREWQIQHPGVALEFYSGGRGIAFGLDGNAWGNADTDHTAQVQWMCEAIFKRELTTVEPGAPGSGPRADWRGPTDDDDLIRRAMKSRSAAGMFQGKASFADLWTRNVASLAASYPYSGDKYPPDPYGQSDADMALIAQLAFWTGCDAARIERLMWRSALVREKWTEHKTYLAMSVASQCAMQKTVLVDKEVAQVMPVLVTAQESAVSKDWMARIGDADEEELRNVVIPEIAQDRTIAQLDRDRLASLIKRRFNEMLFPVSINQCREMLRVQVTEAGDAGPVPEWATRHVYVMASDCFFDLQTAALITRTGFCAQYDRMMPTRPNGDREDAAKWCLHRWNIATVSDVMYWPGREPVFNHEGKWFANWFSPATLPEAALQYTEKGVAAINAFLLHVRAFCGQRAEVYTGLIDWMAWCVQNPGSKCRYAPLLKGVQGDGKSMIISALRAALGGSNVGSVGTNLICSDFNDWAEGTCVTGLEEMMIAGRKRYSVANSLKEPISNDTLTVNRKGKKGLAIHNVTNYIAFTNFVDAVPLEDNDRRWWVIFSPYSSRESMQRALNMTSEDEVAAHFTVIFDSFISCRGEWRKFLTEHVVSDSFRPLGTAPQTTEKSEMRQSGEDPVEAVARQCIEGGGIGVTASVLSSSSLTSMMRAICMQDGITTPQTSSVNHMLTRLGFSFVRVVKWDGKAHRVWWKRGEVASDSNDTLRSLLEHSKHQVTGL